MTPQNEKAGALAEQPACKSFDANEDPTTKLDMTQVSNKLQVIKSKQEQATEREDFDAPALKHPNWIRRSFWTPEKCQQCGNPYDHWRTPAKVYWEYLCPNCNTRNHLDYRELQFHPAADIFPMMQGADYDVLVDDIRENGLQQPIVLHGEKILDGRNRYRACLDAGISPDFEMFLGNDPLEFVTSLNLHRRHLDQSQRAMIAARIADMKQGARTDLASIEAKSQSDAAELLNVSRSNVQRAHQVIESGDKELIAAVDHGEVAVSKAVKQIKAVSVQPAPAKIKPVDSWDANEAVDRIHRVLLDELENFVSPRELNKIIMLLKQITSDLEQRRADA